MQVEVDVAELASADFHKGDCMTNEEWAIDAAMSERDAKITAIAQDIDNPPGQDWPERLDGWTVDDAIECLEIDRHADVENELLMLAPQTYELRKQLSGVWPRLSLMARDQIRMAAAHLLSDI